MKTRARMEILNYITRFCLSWSSRSGLDNRCYGDGNFKPIDDPVTGDLVALQSAPISEWYLSWVIQREEKGSSYDDKYLLESVDSNKLCNWENVSFYRLDRKIVDNHPQWRWEDKQFELRDKWVRAFKRRNAYIFRPCIPIFHDDGSVSLPVRKMFDQGEIARSTFPNWKKVLVRDMLEFYDSVNND